MVSVTYLHEPGFLGFGRWRQKKKKPPNVFGQYDNIILLCTRACVSGRFKNIIFANPIGEKIEKASPCVRVVLPGRRWPYLFCSVFCFSVSRNGCWTAALDSETSKDDNYYTVRVFRHFVIFVLAAAKRASLPKKKKKTQLPHVRKQDAV